MWAAAVAAAFLLWLAAAMHGGSAAPKSLTMMHEADSDVEYAKKAESSAGGGRAEFAGPVATASLAGQPAAAPSDKPEGAEQSAKLTLASMSDSQVDRYLIKNAIVTIEAKDVIQAASQATEFAKSKSGYVSNSHETVDGLGLKNETLELRVPAIQFDSSMQSIAGLGRVLDSQVTSEDVTEQYVDTESQLRNLKETEARLLDHLKQTGRLSDILLVETEVNRVRSSIDGLEGKMRFMSHRISYSTISLTFKEPAHPEPIAPVESFSLGQVATQAMRSVSGFMQSVMSAGVWVVIWSVFWAPLLIGGRYIYIRYFRSAGRHVG